MNGQIKLFAVFLFACAASILPAGAAHVYFGFGLCPMLKIDNHSLGKTIDRCARNLVYARSSEDKASDYYAVAQLYQINHQYELAVENYTNAIGWWHADAQPYWSRGDAYSALGKAELAKADYDEAARLSGALPNIAADRCWLRAIRGGPFDLAMADCNEALSKKPDDSASLFSRCFVHYRLMQYEPAVSDCKAALSLKPKLAGALYIGGLAKHRIGDESGSKADIAAATALSPEIAEGYATFGVTP